MSIITKSLIVAAALLTAGHASAESITLDDGTVCTIIEGHSVTGGMSTSVTAGNGKVTSSTTTGQTASSSTATSSASSSSAGSASADSFSTASKTRADGSVVTKRSDGTCSITNPSK
ncbi:MULTISPECIES: hypothetical protein [unclassified Rhizobium]|uniref:hypothetical protein n=1 Tax=unclassified Rhizobium TaxID=2613769 RepID=UPI000DB9F020|nr:hypothetical protein [Rhizobium sp. AN80A]